MLAGTPDHYVTLRLSPALKYGICGHPSWLHGHGGLLRNACVYVPPGTSGLQFAVAEPDEPRSRRVKLTAPDGTVLFDGVATGGYCSPSGEAWDESTAGFAQGRYDGKLLGVEVSDGPNDYLLKIGLQQPAKGPFDTYAGMGSCAVYCPDEATARAIRGGTRVVDDELFWHPFQVRFHHWLKANPLDGNDRQKALRKELVAEFNGLRLLETSDGRGTTTWPNWSYAMGYYGCHIFKPGWIDLAATTCRPT